MQIECPDCVAAYEVPEAEIRPGRAVRCARCGVEWRPLGDLPEIREEPLSGFEAARPGGGLAARLEAGHALRRHAEPMPAQHETTAARVASRVASGAGSRSGFMSGLGGGGLGIGIGWAASLLVLLGTLGSVVHWRQDVMRDWPPAARLYMMFGAQPHRR